MFEKGGSPVGLVVSEPISTWNGVILSGVEMHHVAQSRVRKSNPFPGRSLPNSDYYTYAPRSHGRLPPKLSQFCHDRITSGTNTCHLCLDDTTS
jgi:hypothetical protein